MSKTKLKKELQTLDKDQLIEVLLSTYSSSAEAKEYLEFFLNPDIDALKAKKIKIVEKELNRTKYGYCKARVSVINKAIKDFAAFGVAPEYVAEFVLLVFCDMLVAERWSNFTATLVTTTGKMVDRYLSECAKAGMLEIGLENLKSVYHDRKIGREAFKAYMPPWIRFAISNLPEGTVLPEFDLNR